MRRQSLWLMLLCVFCGPSVAAPPVGLLARLELRQPAVDILAGARRVQTFRLNTNYDPLKTTPNSPQGQAFDGFEVTATGQEQGASFAHRLASALFNDRTYEGLEMKCILVPGVGFRVWRGQTSVDVLVCFHCADLEMRTKDAAGKEVSQTRAHFGLVQPALLALAREAFPADPALRALAPSVDDRAWSLLLAAEATGHPDLVQTLLDKGFDIEAKDLFERTALCEACVFGFHRLAVLLVNRGADVNAAGPHDKTPLMWAENDPALANLLRAHGAKEREPKPW